MWYFLGLAVFKVELLALKVRLNLNKKNANWASLAGEVNSTKVSIMCPPNLHSVLQYSIIECSCSALYSVQLTFHNNGRRCCPAWP